MRGVSIYQLRQPGVNTWVSWLQYKHLVGNGVRKQKSRRLDPRPIGSKVNPLDFSDQWYTNKLEVVGGSTPGCDVCSYNVTFELHSAANDPRLEFVSSIKGKLKQLVDNMASKRTSIPNLIWEMIGGVTIKLRKAYRNQNQNQELLVLTKQSMVTLHTMFYSWPRQKQSSFLSVKCSHLILHKL